MNTIDYKKRIRVKNSDLPYYSLPPLLTIAVLLIVYIIKGVYPFGNSNISYYDMNIQYIPLYARNYQIFHGQDSFIFDWLTGSGMDMTGSYTGYTLYPINWILFFVKPDHIVAFMAAFLMMKLMISSVTISLYIRRVYETGLSMHIALCMIYVFSAYVVQQYMNIFFLDSMMTFPLLMLAFRGLCKKGNGIPYLLMLTLQMIGNGYLGYMTLLYLLFYSFGLLYTMQDMNERRILSARVGIYTFASVFLSGITFVPGVLRTASSSRVDDYTSFNFLDVFMANKPEEYFLNQKLFLLLNLELALALLFIILFRRIVKKESLSSGTALRVFLFVLMLVPIFNESALLLWHLTSYSHFPYRHGYILVFSAIELIAYLWKYKQEIPKFELTGKTHKIVLVSAVTVLTFIPLLLLNHLAAGFLDVALQMGKSFYPNILLIFALNTAAFIILLLFAKKKTCERIFLPLSIIRLTIVSVCFIAPYTYSEAAGTLDKFQMYLAGHKWIEETASIRKADILENDNLSRVKVLYPALGVNYGEILGVPTINQWANDATSEYVNEIGALGYLQPGVVNYDWGGTIFSDALLNNKIVIVYKDADVPEELYTKYADTENHSIYSMNYTLPFGMMADDRILALNDIDTENVLEHQEIIANAVSDNTEKLFHEISPDIAVSSEVTDKTYNYMHKYDIHIDTASALYVSLDIYAEITVNGEQLVKPFFDELDNTIIRPSFQTILIGCFSAGEDVTICINTPSKNAKDNHLAILDLDVMAQLQDKYEHSCASYYKAGKNRLDITADVNGNNYMFLPLEYVDGWHAEVNGEKAEIFPVLNNAFMAVKLPDGHCEITMKFMPFSIIIGALVSLSCIVVVTVISILKMKGFDIMKTAFLGNAAYIILNITAISALIVIYLLPLII